MAAPGLSSGISLRLDLLLYNHSTEPGAQYNSDKYRSIKESAGGNVVSYCPPCVSMCNKLISVFPVKQEYLAESQCLIGQQPLTNPQQALIFLPADWSLVTAVCPGPFALRLLGFINVSEPIECDLVLDGGLRVTWRFKNGCQPLSPRPV